MIRIMEREVCKKFIKIGEKHYHIENSEIGPDSETSTAVIPENQWPSVSIPKHSGLEDKDP